MRQIPVAISKSKEEFVLSGKRDLINRILQTKEIILLIRLCWRQEKIICVGETSTVMGKSLGH